MTAGIFAIQEDGQLVEMSEEPYASEDIFQTLLEKYPNLLAGDQIDSVAPRRWLLIQREMGVPAQENGYGRWSIDHLFLDQDAVPTLVEVKRSSDTRIRREVVGQMLDYAANGVVYWPVEKIRACFEATCTSQDVDPDQRLSEFLEDDSDAEKYWQLVKTNLKAGKIRLIFVADQIPTELKRIVEFLNEQMSPAEVLAVEIKQYVGQGLKTLVPKVIGQTVEAQLNKAVTRREKRQWDESSFLEELQARDGDGAVKVAQQMLEWARQHQLKIAWGEGTQWGAFRLFLPHNGQTYRLCLAWTSEKIEISFKYLRRQSPFESPELFAELLDRLYAIDDVDPIKDEWRETYTSIKYRTLQKQETLDQLLQFYDWVIAQLKVSN